jgi:hypothetical protein
MGSKDAKHQNDAYWRPLFGTLGLGLWDMGVALYYWVGTKFLQTKSLQSYSI